MSDIIYDVIDNDIVSRLSSDSSQRVPNSIIAKFYLGAVVNVGIYWILNIDKYTKQELIDYLCILIPDEIAN